MSDDTARALVTVIERLDLSRVITVGFLLSLVREIMVRRSSSASGIVEEK